MITTVLFDFGGVFTPSPFAAVKAGGAVNGHDPEVLLALVFGPYDRDTDHPWHQLERGEISFSDCHSQLRQLATDQGIDADPLEALRGMGSGERHDEPFVARGLKLRAEGYRTGLITNNIKEFSAGWRSLLPVDDLFEVVIDSCEVGMRKPNPRIFQLALEKLGHPEPNQTVFIDDYQGNIDAANALGMHGILVGADRAAAVDELDALLDRHRR